MSRILAFLLFLLPLGGCQTLRPEAANRAAPGSVTAAPLQGTFDNHEQVWAAGEQAGGGIAPPHVIVGIEPTGDDDWTIWRIHFDASTSLDAVWAMQRIDTPQATLSFLPHRALHSAPALGATFDAGQWAPLDGCTLRGTSTPTRLRASADVAACTMLAPGIGAQAALLPIDIEREGEWLRVRLYADQARGADAREAARKVETFVGWAAINGAGPNATGDSSDWHMDRTLQLGSEGGRAVLKWRDGKPSGYSLRLERLTYRDGNIPVLKLSIIDDADGRAVAYSWANPEATRIGINLGWVQVGLDRSAAAAGKR